MKTTFETTRQTVASRKLQQQRTVVQVSDLHDACFGADQSLLIHAIGAEQPDWIVCTGDLFNRRKPDACQNAYRFIERAVRIAPVYVVEGNHEAALGPAGTQHLLATVQRGAVLLQDARMPLGDVNLIGLRQRASRETLQSLTDPNRFNLVLCHRPELFPTYAETDADLILCGHAHGGQIRVAGRALYAPQQGWLPRYTGGMYERQGTQMFVSRGLGDTIPIPRIHVPHELNVLTLLPIE